MTTIEILVGIRDDLQADFDRLYEEMSVVTGKLAAVDQAIRAIEPVPAPEPEPVATPEPVAPEAPQPVQRPKAPHAMRSDTVELRARVVAILTDEGQALQPAKIRERLGIAEQRFKDLTRRMVADGELVRSGWGRGARLRLPDQPAPEAAEPLPQRKPSKRRNPTVKRAARTQPVPEPISAAEEQRARWTDADRDAAVLAEIVRGVGDVPGMQRRLADRLTAEELRDALDRLVRARKVTVGANRRYLASPFDSHSPIRRKRDAKEAANNAALDAGVARVGRIARVEANLLKWPGTIEQVAERTGLDLEQVTDAIEHLDGRGVIRRDGDTLTAVRRGRKAKANETRMQVVA